MEGCWKIVGITKGLPWAGRGDETPGRRKWEDHPIRLRAVPKAIFPRGNTGGGTVWVGGTMVKLSVYGRGAGRKSLREGQAPCLLDGEKEKRRMDPWSGFRGS